MTNNSGPTAPAETQPTVRTLKTLLGSYLHERVPSLTRVYDYEPGHVQGLPCVTLLSRRYDPVQAETGPHDDTTYEWRVRLYVALNDYQAAQYQIDELIPLLLDVPRHHATMEGRVDFLVMYDPGGEPTFSAIQGWAAYDLIARVVRTEL